VQELQQAVHALQGGGSGDVLGELWRNDPFWVLTLQLLQSLCRGASAVKGVQEATAVMAAAQTCTVALLPVVGSLSEHGVFPTHATLGLWAALQRVVPGLTLWRHALTPWEGRRALVLFWAGSAEQQPGTGHL
jgi:hypothetical protein